MVPLLVAAAAVLTGMAMAVTVRPVLFRLSEPATEDGPGKVAYRVLPTPAFVLACAAIAAAAQLVAGLTLPASVWPMWTVLATAGVLLAAIDAATTWLPLSLTRAAWVLMAGAAVSALGLGATLGDLGRTVAGAVIAGALYLLVWAVTRGGFGYGDVRYAPLLGAATAGDSWTLLVWALTLGTAVGAGHGITRLIRRRPGAFPYAPSMLAGCYLAAAARRLLLS